MLYGWPPNWGCYSSKQAKLFQEDSNMLDWHNENLQIAHLQPNKDDFFHRSHLHALLEEATQRHVVTIVAGAGYGKSTAVSAFLSEQQQYTIWLSLKDLDNLETRFWESLCSSFRLKNQKKGNPLLNFHFPASDFAFDNLAKILNRELYSNQRYYLVLDDYFKITNPTIHEFIEKFISMPIPNLCIIIISRKEPPINTNALLSQNLLYQINDIPLTLTENEMSNFFQRQGILLMEQAKSEFYNYTGGWFFATYLVSLSLKKGMLYRTNPLNAVKLDIFSLLEKELYSGLSKQLKDLLLKLSLIACPPLELVGLLAEDRRDLVDQLLNISSFITFDKFSSSIRIHHLFLDFLQLKQNSLPNSDKNRLFLAAAKWYEQNDYRIDAITYYEKIKYYDQIIRILQTFTKTVTEKTTDFLLAVIDRMPRQIWNERPLVRFLYIKFLMNNYRMDEVKRRSSTLRQELEVLPPTLEIMPVLGELYMHLGFESLIVSGITKTYEFPEYFKIAHTCLPEGCKLIRKPYVSSGHYICNVCSPEAGEMDKFICAIKQMLPAATKLLPNTFGGYDSLAQAEFAYFRKDTKAAEKYITEAISKAQADQSDYMETNALFLQTRISIDSGNYAKAISSLEQQKQLIKRAVPSESYAIHDITTGWFYSHLGCNDLVPSWIRDEQQSREVMTPVTFAADKLVRAKCLLNDNEIYELLAALTKKSDTFTFEYYLFGAIEMKVMKAIALNLIKEYEEAAQVLQEAYELALPNKIIMPFIENGKYTRTLIKRTAPYLNIPPNWLDDIQKKATTYAKRLSKITADFQANLIAKAANPNLSHRETEILTSLSQNLTRDEIANAYGLSVNTVKSTINNIHNKLGVNTSIDAIRVATQLGLI